PLRNPGLAVTAADVDGVDGGHVGVPERLDGRLPGEFDGGPLRLLGEPGGADPPYERSHRVTAAQTSDTSGTRTRLTAVPTAAGPASPGRWTSTRGPSTRST